MLAVLACVASAALAACGMSAVAAQRPRAFAAPSTGCGGVIDTAAGFKKAKWGSNVTMIFSVGHVEIKSNGVPNHRRQAEYALPDVGVIVPTAGTAHAGPDPTKAQHLDFTITTCPRKAAKPTSASLGPIGIMISGAVLFNPYEGNGRTVALASNFTVRDSQGRRVAFVDSCNGHPTPMGLYHYHGLPTCIIVRVDKPHGPSHIIGVAADGFPIYGDRDIHGKQAKAAQLDRCNGIFSPTPEFPHGLYHYVLLDTKNSRSSIRCFAGKISR